MVRVGVLTAVVVLVLLAGCGGTIDQGSQPTVTISAAPIPTENPTPTPRPQLAPGLDPTGIVDPLALSEAHERYLRNRSETVHLTRTNRYQNGTLRDRTVQVTKVAQDRDRFHTIIEVDGPKARFFGDGGRGEYWSDGERLLQRLVRQNESVYSLVEPEDYNPQLSQPLIPSPGGGRVYFLATLGTFDLTDRRSQNGTELYRLELRQITQPDALAASESVYRPRNVSLRLLIDENGVLRRFVLTYTAVQEGTTLDVHLTGEHKRIGQTSVERPPWYPRAINETK